MPDRRNAALMSGIFLTYLQNYLNIIINVLNNLYLEVLVMGIWDRRYSCTSCGLTLTERGAENSHWECPSCGGRFDGDETSPDKIADEKKEEKNEKEKGR